LSSVISDLSLSTVTEQRSRSRKAWEERAGTGCQRASDCGRSNHEASPQPTSRPVKSSRL
jgi:hypothetical protein